MDIYNKWWLKYIRKEDKYTSAAPSATRPWNSGLENCRSSF